MGVHVYTGISSSFIKMLIVNNPFFPSLSGHQLCRTAWIRFLGIGKARLNRTKKRYRGVDERGLNQCSLAASYLQNQLESLYGAVSKNVILRCYYP